MIPKIQREVLLPVAKEIGGEDWTITFWDRMKVEQPILAEYINAMRPRVNDEAIVMALAIFRMIEVQIEVEDLENMFLKPKGEL